MQLKFFKLIKLILMSATLDATIFQEYYAKVERYLEPSLNKQIQVIKCEFSCFEVDLFYLEKIKRLLKLYNHEVNYSNYYR